MRKYYAGTNAYDARVDWSSIGWSFWAFDSKADRDKYVEDNKFGWNGNLNTIAVTRKQVCEAMGSNWVISKEGRVCADDQDADEWDYKIRCYREFRKAGIL